jgi:hypothetical protein
VVDEEWPLRRAAERFQVSATTAARYRQLGEAGMADRPSRPHRCPRRTPSRTERRIIKVRVTRRWDPARIGWLLGLHPSTVHRVLARYRLARLVWPGRGTGRVVRRYEHAALGDLARVDVKKLGKIPDGGGHRVTDRMTVYRSKKATTTALPARQAPDRLQLPISYVESGGVAAARFHAPRNHAARRQREGDLRSVTSRAGCRRPWPWAGGVPAGL